MYISKFALLNWPHLQSDYLVLIGSILIQWTIKLQFFHYQGVCIPPQIVDPENNGECCDVHALNGTQCACVSPQINDPNNDGECCFKHALGNGTQCACVPPLINDPDNNGECCEEHALGNGRQCACVLPEIDHPDHDGFCCEPVSNDNTTCKG